ncbi:MAG: glycine zipper 2TM domain-containing protein, partial [Aeromonas sp.]|nr:glycine zipper 2TM domain-containing protein [Aeromonas sp.]
MEMKKRGMSALALLGSLLLMSGAVQASETLNTILGGGAGGVAGTMIGKELGGDTGALVGAALGGAAGGAATANKGNKNEAA